MRFAAFFVAVTWLLAAAGGAETDVGESMVCDEDCWSCPTDCISGCACDPGSRFWVRGEYLMWWTKGMSVPPLVTTSPQGTLDDDAGVIGRPDTRILFGDERLFDELRWGTRLRIGTWTGCCRDYGVEGEYFALGDETGRFRRQSDGLPILARPFFNVLPNVRDQDSELIAYPDVIAGTVTADTLTELESVGLRVRINWRRMGSFCGNACGGGSACGCGDAYGCEGGCQQACGCGARLDFLVGYRYMHLDEDLVIREDLQSLNPIAPTEFDITDAFDTENDFHGAEIGLLLEYERCRWSLEVLAKIALGNSHQVARINGDTTITTYGVPDGYPGGILAQRTNIGEYGDDQFAVVPEVGITLGYQLTCRLRATFGYSFIYWSDVARPGEQIDTRLNPNLFPPEQVPFSGALRPRFVFRDTDFWAQGLNFGVDYLW
ncbi:MAG TPA: BBP7 family outer membrane beta-barrel protein [Thermoguttaceae bacterium]|nr:BBP7 family outer membrane beta-barrel protein [Thermoguttaceae bacterium]